jgi:glycosyltransferase involved in cell wall biosynthesis
MAVMNTNPHPPLFGEVGVIALVPDRWGPSWQARHQIATRLARYFQVVWVDRPPTRQEAVRWFRRRSLVWQPAGTPAGFQVYCPGPLSPNLGRPAWLRRWLSRERLRQAQRLLRERGCSRIVLYLWRPEFADSLNLLNHDLSCYHIDDEYSFSPVERELDAPEVQLIRAVAQVFIHSPAMMRKKGALNPNTQLVPNGVDYQKYSTPTPEAADLRSIPKPRIGYTGNLKRMLDWRLLLELSGAHPEWSFVLVGHMLPQLEVLEVRDELSRRQNIYVVGPRPSELIPGYVQHFDVCIMPYKVDDYTKYIYPLKLHEYLAGGNPVVGSTIPALQAFEEVVLLADGSDEWSSMITRALSAQENTSERRTARQQVAARFDWDLLVEKLARTLARRLGFAFPDAMDDHCQHLSQGELPLAGFAPH